MIGRVGLLPVLGAVIVLASGCLPQDQSGTSPGGTAGAASSASGAGDVTSKDFCALVSAEQLSGVTVVVLDRL